MERFWADNEYMEKLKGKITVSRRSSNIKNDYIVIEVHDQLSGACFLEAEMELKDFALALTGQGYIDCEFELQPKVVGKRRETKTEFVPYKTDYKKNKDKEHMREALKPFEVDGWKGYEADLNNHHHSGKRNGLDGYSVTFVRFVDAQSEQESQ